jgi:hypothetical protein
MTATPHVAPRVVDRRGVQLNTDRQGRAFIPGTASASGSPSRQICRGASVPDMRTTAVAPASSAVRATARPWGVKSATNSSSRFAAVTIAKFTAQVTKPHGGHTPVSMLSLPLKSFGAKLIRCAQFRPARSDPRQQPSTRMRIACKQEIGPTSSAPMLSVERASNAAVKQQHCAHGAMTHSRECAFDDVGRAQMFQVLGGEVVEGEQCIGSLIKPSTALSYLTSQVSTKTSNAASASFLVSAIQTSCSARLAFDCWLFGSLLSTLAVLCTQQRGSRAILPRLPARTRARRRRPRAQARSQASVASGRAGDPSRIAYSRARHQSTRQAPSCLPAWRQ